MKGKFLRSLSAVAAGIAVSATCFVSPLSAPSAFAEPTTAAEAKAELDRIQEEYAKIGEEYAASAERLEESKKNQARAEEQLVTQRQIVSESRVSVSRIARSNYQSIGLGPAANLLTSGDEDNFLSAMATRQAVDARAATKLQTNQEEQSRLTTLENESSKAKESIQAELNKQAELMAEYERQEANAQRIYDRLSAEEIRNLARLNDQEARQRQAQILAQDAIRSATNSRSAAASEANSERGAAILSFGLSQLGKNYVYGATGPTAYDCSGLTQAAYRNAGVSIPRTSQAQFSSGTPVSTSELMPGDLVFYYKGITHVGIYIGDGQIVHASNPRRGIIVSPVFAMPYQGARRFG